MLAAESVLGAAPSFSFGQECSGIVDFLRKPDTNDESLRAR